MPVQHGLIDTAPSWLQTSGRKNLSISVSHKDKDHTAHHSSHDSTSVSAYMERSMERRRSVDSSGSEDEIDTNYAKREREREREKRNSLKSQGRMSRSSPRGRSSRSSPDAPPAKMHKAASFIQARVRGRQTRKRLKRKKGNFVEEIMKDWAHAGEKILLIFGCA